MHRNNQPANPRNDFSDINIGRSALNEKSPLCWWRGGSCQRPFCGLIPAAGLGGRSLPQNTKSCRRKQPRERFAAFQGGIPSSEEFLTALRRRGATGSCHSQARAVAGSARCFPERANRATTRRPAHALILNHKEPAVQGEDCLVSNVFTPGSE